MEEQPLVDLLSQIGLRNVVRRGGNVMASCPSGNHPDRRPSWGISLSSPHPHGCFSCGFRGKTLYSLLVEAGGMSMRQARIVCGIDEALVDTKALTLKSKEKKLKEFSVEELFPFFPTKRSDLYFQLRGLSLPVIRKLELMHDPKQNRVVYPWYIENKLAAATGRTLSPNEAAQGRKLVCYFEGMPKRDLLYIPARKVDTSPLILVEGEFDAAKVYEAGFENVGALGHSDLSDGQLNLTLNFPTSEIWVFTDDDKAGEKAWNAINLKLKGKRIVRRIGYDDIRKNYTHLIERGWKLDPGSLDIADIRIALSPNGGGQLFSDFSRLMSCSKLK